MKVTSINQTIRYDLEPTRIRVEGSFIVITYPDKGGVDLFDVYYNDQGREVFQVTLEPVVKPQPWYIRLWKLITKGI